MQMIKSSSFYASVHQVFFQIDNSEVPIYLELVHNTDDDQITLIAIFDV